MERPVGLREEHLCLAWERQMLQAERLVTVAGDSFQVVYPGRRGGDPGPDFRDAVIALSDSSLLHGDVEVHLERAGWAAHGHGANPAYDRVILHVTLAEAEPVVTSAGSGVPGLALNTCLAIPLEALARMPVRHLPPPGATCPCAVRAEHLPEVPAFLEEQGMVRLEARAALMAADAAVVGYDQTFWVALLRGLGYQRNVTAFQRLAGIVPWSAAASIAGRTTVRSDLPALLLGAAGLLEEPPRSLPPADEAARRWYRARWQALQGHCADRPLRRSDWTAAAVRPENMPARRIAAAAGIAFHYRSGLSMAFESTVRIMEQPLRVVADDDPFWSRRADLGRPVGPEPIALLGLARERELLVNAVLPGVLAIACDQEDSSLQRAVHDRYRRLGKTGPNQITQHMLRTIGAPPRLVATAAAEQGLLHLYHRWCRERRCWDCPLPAAFSTVAALAAGGGDVAFEKGMEA